MKAVRYLALIIFASSLFVETIWAADVNDHLNVPARMNIPSFASLTWASKYLSDGFSIGGDHPVMQVGLRFPILNSEFSLMLWSTLQLERENKKFDENDLLLQYQHLFLQDSKFLWLFHSYYCYWFYPNSQPIKDSFGDTISDVQRHGSKVHLGVSFLELIPVGDSYIVPSYNIYYWLYWAQDRKDLNQSGTRHEVILSYEHWLPKFSSSLRSAYGVLESSMNYNDGAFAVKRGWTHATVSASYGIKVAGSDFVAGVHQQWSFESSLNPNDEIWTSLSFVHLL